MTHPIFKTLKEFHLLSDKTRIKRILDLSQEELLRLFNELEVRAYGGGDVSGKGSNAFELAMPYPTHASLAHIPTYLFLFDRVRFVDPLYDAFCLLEIANSKGPLIDRSNVRRLMLERQKHLSPNTWKWLSSRFEPASNYASYVDQFTETLVEPLRNVAAQLIDRIIGTYVQYRDLFDEGVLVPYIPVNLDYDPADQEEALLFAVNAGAKMGAEALTPETTEKIEELAMQVLDGRMQRPQALGLALESLRLPERLGAEWEMVSFYATSLKFKSMFPASRSPNLDLNLDHNKERFDLLVDLGCRSLGKQLKTFRKIEWPRPEHEALFHALNGIAPQELLTVRMKEKSALDHFKFRAQRKLIEMQAAVGSSEYKQVILSHERGIKMEIAEVQMLAEHVRRKYLRKIGQHVGIATISAGAAILSAIAVVGNPIALIGLGAGGAGMSKGLVSLFENWINYQDDLDSLKKKDGYILWKARQLKKP